MAVAVALYAWVGQPQPAAVAWPGGGAAPAAQDLPLSLGDLRPPALGERRDPHPDGGPSLDDRITSLQQRLAAQPDDLPGWVLLARSHTARQQFGPAVQALERALALAPGHPDVLADLADALAMNQQRSLQGRPILLVEQALRARSDHPKALALAATHAMNQSRPEDAVRHWRALQATFAPDAPDVQQIEALIARLQTAQPATPKPAPTAWAVEATVTLDPAVQGAIRRQPPGEQAVLYVVARAAGGGPMPVAVQRVEGAELRQWLAAPPGAPLRLRLDERHLMQPEAGPPPATALSLEARLSRDGQARRAAGDLLSEPVAGVAAGAVGGAAGGAAGGTAGGTAGATAAASVALRLDRIAP